MWSSCFDDSATKSAEEDEELTTKATASFAVLESLIFHEKFVANGRTISYGMGGDLGSKSTILVFPPLSGKHRMLIMMHSWTSPTTCILFKQ